MHVVTYSHDDAGTFVASNTFGVVVHGDAKVSPFVVDEGLVGGTETGPEMTLRDCECEREREACQLILTRIESASGICVSMSLTGAVASPPLP